MSMLPLILVTASFVLAKSAPVFRSECFNGPPIEGDTGEFGKHFEGDILLTREQERAILSDNRNGLKASARRWPDKTVIYEIVEDDFDEDQIEQIKAALDDIANNSCIKFSERKDSEHAVTIQGTANGCFSNVGFAVEDGDKANQVLNLAKGCFRHGTIVHEMLHTIGFYHMQSTYNRDDYVKIIWENIRAGTEHNFAKYNNETVTDFGVEYDYSSVMHYPDTAFSCGNQTKTIVPLKDGQKVVDQTAQGDEEDNFQQIFLQHGKKQKY